MGILATQKPVKLVVSLIFRDENFLDHVEERLRERYGFPEQLEKKTPFEYTDYYREEFGSPLKRKFICFKDLVRKEDIASVKLETNRIEERLAVKDRRRVNLDPGYMDCDKVVLASAKYNGQKIYLDHGIWADLTLHYEQKGFRPYPWSFPDFKRGMYDEVFLEIRKRYRKQRRGE